MVHFVFFSNSIATPVLPPLPWSICLTSLLHMSCTIPQELHFMSILRKFSKLRKNIFFGKVVGLQHPNLLKGNPAMSVFLSIVEIIFWWIFQNSYYMESLQIIDKFCSSPLVIFLNMAYIFMSVIRNRKIFHRLFFFITRIYLNALCLINFHSTLF